MQAHVRIEAPSARTHGHIMLAAFSLPVQYPQTDSTPLGLDSYLPWSAGGGFHGDLERRSRSSAAWPADQPLRFNLINLDDNCTYVEPNSRSWLTKKNERWSRYAETNRCREDCWDGRHALSAAI